ncbi:MAG: PCMD domain-containing protein [Tannerellaceae bacterium]
MKLKHLSLLLILLFGATSCIQDAPLNPEADILSISLPGNVTLGEPVFNQNSISIYVTEDANITDIAPIIDITEGATISPASGTSQNFTNSVVYTVTSQDKKNKRVYFLQLIRQNSFEYNFDYWSENNEYKYKTPVEIVNDQIQRIWASSNQGVSVYQQFASADQYPVFPTETAYSGKYAAKLVTKEGPGNILNIQYIPIVSGSLFTGTMNLLNALKDPLKATQFGQPYSEKKKPIRLIGYYNYKAGTGSYIGKDGNPIPEMKDSCAIYSVLYKTDDSVKSLDGTNIMTDPNIVAITKNPARSSTIGNGFVQFDVEFEYRREPDFNNETYKLAIILASSFYGDRYEGCIGSTLIVDNISIIMDTNNE